MRKQKYNIQKAKSKYRYFEVSWKGQSNDVTTSGVKHFEVKLHNPIYYIGYIKKQHNLTYVEIISIREIDFKDAYVQTLNKK